MPSHLKLISGDYKKQLQAIHEAGKFGAKAHRHADNIRALALGGTILDYGCGPGVLAEALAGSVQVMNYDPAVPRFAADPQAANVVACTDVLEHIEPEHLAHVMHHIHGLAVDLVYFCIALRLDGSKLLPDGRNPHLIVKPMEWWRGQIERLFEIRYCESNEKEMICIAKPKPITVVVWKWGNGWRSVYTAKHVNTMKRMIDRHLSVPHRFLCITDDPKGCDCETMQLWDFPVVPTMPRKPNCYRRLRMFDDWARDAIGDRFISVDLDGVILRNIDHLVQRDEDFVILEGRAAPYNGSLWMHRTGTRKRAWDKFDPKTSPAIAASQRRSNGRGFYGSDQAWISHILRDEATYTHAADGVSQFGNAIKNGQRIPPHQSIVFFAGSLKPWDSHVAAMAPTLAQEYMAFYNGMI